MSREARRFSTENQFAHSRMDAVGADYQVPMGYRAVVKFYFDVIRMRLDVNASMIETNHVIGQRCGQNIEQLGAMKMMTGCPKVRSHSSPRSWRGEYTPIVLSANLRGQ